MCALGYDAGMDRASRGNGGDIIDRSKAVCDGPTCAQLIDGVFGRDAASFERVGRGQFQCFIRANGDKQYRTEGTPDHFRTVQQIEQQHVIECPPRILPVGFLRTFTGCTFSAIGGFRDNILEQSGIRILRAFGEFVPDILVSVFAIVVSAGCAVRNRCAGDVGFQFFSGY